MRNLPRRPRLIYGNRSRSMTKHRPLIRKHGAWWRIFIGHTDHALGDYYTTNTAAHDAAIRYANKRSSLA